jgi:hypothetical protein
MTSAIPPNDTRERDIGAWLAQLVASLIRSGLPIYCNPRFSAPGDILVVRNESTAQVDRTQMQLHARDRRYTAHSKINRGSREDLKRRE